MALVTGTLIDFGLDPLEGFAPRLIFRPSSPGLSGIALLSTKPVEVIPAANGYFEVDLTPTAEVSPAMHYTIQIQWVQVFPERKTRTETLPWELEVPAAGGFLADLLRVPSNPALVWSGEEPPANPAPGSWWLKPSTGDLDEYTMAGWENKANLRGPAGYNAAGAAEDAQALANFVNATAGPNAFWTALRNKIIASTGLNVKEYGAKGDGVADDTAAIQAASNAAAPGQALIFPRTGSGAWYKITGPITVTVPSQRWVGQPRDGYAVSIRCAVANTVMVAVKAASFVLQDLAFLGDSAATNGAGATVVGLDLYGDTDGNIDAAIRGATFQGLAIGARTRARNATFSNDTLFSNCLKGIVIDGKDAVYHTGPAAAENRGNTIRNCRFHNIGAAGTDAAIEVTTNTKVLHATIAGNWFDSNGLGRHIAATGTAAAPHARIDMLDNKHTECQAPAYELTYVSSSTINGASIAGNTGGSYGDGIVLKNTTAVTVSNIFGIQIGKTGLVARDCASLVLANIHFQNVGQDPAVVGHGFDIDATCTNPKMRGLLVGTADGWGFIGSPFRPSLTDFDALTATLGRISSTTVVNHAARGENAYSENGFGRIEDRAAKAFTLPANTATKVATVAVGSSYGAFLLTVELTGRTGVVGTCYLSVRRYVRPENGAPVTAVIGTDAAANVALSLAANGTNGVDVNITSTEAAYANVTVKAAAGSAANAVNPRGVTVTMA